MSDLVSLPTLGQTIQSSYSSSSTSSPTPSSSNPILHKDYSYPDRHEKSEYDYHHTSSSDDLASDTITAHSTISTITNDSLTTQTDRSAPNTPIKDDKEKDKVHEPIVLNYDIDINKDKSHSNENSIHNKEELDKTILQVEPPVSSVRPINQQQHNIESQHAIAEHINASHITSTIAATTTGKSPPSDDISRRSSLSSKADDLPMMPLSPGTAEEIAIVTEAKGVGQQDTWIEVQEKTFLRWVNFILSKRNLSASTLNDFDDGNLLNNMLEILSDKKVPKWKYPAKTQVQRIDNLNVAFNFMQNEEKLKLINIRPASIESQNHKMLLGLMWSLIVHYQIEKSRRLQKEHKRLAEEEGEKSLAIKRQQAAEIADQHERERAEKELADAIKANKEAKLKENKEAHLTAKADLLNWVNNQIISYDVTPAHDFSTSWQDGKVLASLTDSLIAQSKGEDINVTSNNQSKIPLSSNAESLTLITESMERAENELHVPILMDASDMASRPQEQAVMTYIAGFRNAHHNIQQYRPVTLQTNSSPKFDHQDKPIEEKAIDALIIAESRAEIRKEREIDTINQENEGSYHGGDNNDDVDLNAPVIKSAESIHSNGQSSTVAPPPSPNHSRQPSDDLVNHGAKPSASPARNFIQTEMRAKGIAQVDVCMTNANLEYIQTDKEGRIFSSNANSIWTVWTVLDDRDTNIVYFRDCKGRYIVSDDRGHIRMGEKTEQAKWTVVRGPVQNFKNYRGQYLTAHKTGQLDCREELTKEASLTLNFPVVEGWLKKKGRSGLKMWQDRYFAYNGAVMSYWKKKEEAASVNSAPSGMYDPRKIESVVPDPNNQTKFEMKFVDGQIVALQARNGEERDRWVHSLEMTGVKKEVQTLKQTKSTSNLK